MSVFFCDCNPETTEHLFWYCHRIFTLCSALTNWIGEVTRIEVEFYLESVLLGYTNCLPCKNAINCIILVVKFFISKCKWKRVTLILLVYKATSSFIIIEGFGGKRALGILRKIELCQKRSKFRIQFCLGVLNNVLHVFSLKLASFLRYYVCEKTHFSEGIL